MRKMLSLIGTAISLTNSVDEHEDKQTNNHWMYCNAAF